VKIAHTKTNVIQYNEYYPFGLQASTSWTRENATENNFLYNEGSELNKTSGWYETMFRNYDPAIGRFTGIDPKATKYASISGYHYSGNNPIMFSDPTGADYYAYERERKYFAEMAASQGKANEQLAWEQQSSQGWFADGSGSGNSPDAWNIMNNFANGVPNSIATGLQSNVPVGAYQNYTWAPFGYYAKNLFTGEIRNVIEGYYKVYRQQPGGPDQERVPSYDLLYSSNRLDIFVETITQASGTKTLIRQNIVFLQFDEEGKEVESAGGYQRIIVKTGNEQRVKYSPLYISPGLNGFIKMIEDFGRPQGLWDKYWDYIFKRTEENEHKNRFHNTSPHR
jgi:RHS repeat-associated protein